MSAVTPRRSTRTPHTHTPKISERKKGLFQGSMAARQSLTQHRKLPVVDSESDPEDCDLGIISTLDSSSGEEPATPERGPRHQTRSQTRLLKESHDLKNFMKSPFTLKKYQTCYTRSDKSTTPLSTPATPHIHRHPITPSSSHSCGSIQTNSSSTSKARKSLASLIADTESCSSSLKDLNFDSDSSSDTKENTPSKTTRVSSHTLKTTPKLATFKGILVEQKKNASPSSWSATALTEMDITSIVSPTQMMKTPHNTSEVSSPPKIGHSRRPVEIAESPELCDMEKATKRVRNDSLSEAPSSKYPKIDPNSAPKARLSLFNADRLRAILSTKSFYGSSNRVPPATVRKMASVAAPAQPRRHSAPAARRRRTPGGINGGVRHKVRKPKPSRGKLLNRSGERPPPHGAPADASLVTDTSMDVSRVSQDTSQEIEACNDPFGSEKLSIDALLRQWTEDEEPEVPLPARPAAVPVPAPMQSDAAPMSSHLVELGAPAAPPGPPGPLSVPQGPPGPLAAPPGPPAEVPGHAAAHGAVPEGCLPVEGGYIVVDQMWDDSEEPTDLDAIEREMRALDEQIVRLARTNNLDPDKLLRSTEAPVAEATPSEGAPKLFPIFCQPNPGTADAAAPAAKPSSGKKALLRSTAGQYVIDAGQKRFGATQCVECGVIYEIGDPQDEHDHLVHHDAIDVLRYKASAGARTVGEWGAARCVQVRGGGAGWARVAEVLARVVHPQLGYPPLMPGQDRVYAYTAYLYVEKRQIIGCLVMEPKSRARRLIPGDPDCCSDLEYPVKCGVSRVWTHAAHRRRGVAGRMLDCARATLLHATPVRAAELAFSAPTAAGKALATSYCGTPEFYVYLE